MKTKIREIRQQQPDGYARLMIGHYEKRFFIVTDFKPAFETYRSKSIRFEVTTKRIQQLANDILNHIDKKMKWEKWEPTMEELERRLDERYHGDGIYMWFIDWVRFPKNKKAGKRIYEWMKGAAERGFFDE